MAVEICGAAKGREARRWLEVHERWVYDETAHVQTLKRLIRLCTDCHTVTHFGHAQVRVSPGRGNRALVRPTSPSTNTLPGHDR